MDAESARPVEHFPDMARGWFRLSHSKPIDCSPPTGCRAIAQQIYYYADCKNETIGLTQLVLTYPDGRGETRVSHQAFMAVQRPPVPDSWDEYALRRLCVSHTHSASSRERPSGNEPVPEWIRDLVPPPSK